MSDKDVEAMNIAFEFSKQLIIARVPSNYLSAEDMAFRLVYALKPYLANKLKISNSEIVLIVISQNNKVVVACDNSWYRNCLYNSFHKPSMGYAQFYDNTDPELIIEKIKKLI